MTIFLQRLALCRDLHRWICENYETDPCNTCCISMKRIYNNYLKYCKSRECEPVNAAELGKKIRKIFPNIRSKVSVIVFYTGGKCKRKKTTFYSGIRKIGKKRRINKIIDDTIKYSKETISTTNDFDKTEIGMPKEIENVDNLFFEKFPSSSLVTDNTIEHMKEIPESTSCDFDKTEIGIQKLEQIDNPGSSISPILPLNSLITDISDNTDRFIFVPEEDNLQKMGGNSVDIGECCPIRRENPKYINYYYRYFMCFGINCNESIANLNIRDPDGYVNPFSNLK